MRIVTRRQRALDDVQGGHGFALPYFISDNNINKNDICTVFLICRITSTRCRTHKTGLRCKSVLEMNLVVSSMMRLNFPDEQ